VCSVSSLASRPTTGCCTGPGTILTIAKPTFGPVNGADHWLHFALGAVMVLLGLTLAGQRDPTKRRRR